MYTQFFSISEHSAGVLELNTSMGLGVQFTWTETRNFSTYADLKLEVGVHYRAFGSGTSAASSYKAHKQKKTEETYGQNDISVVNQPSLYHAFYCSLVCCQTSSGRSQLVHSLRTPIPLGRSCHYTLYFSLSVSSTMLLC